MRQAAEEEKIWPPVPKKPLNAYMIFASETREVVKAENPNISGKDLAKTLGETWSGLSAADKAPWLGKANEQKEQYDAQIELYVQEHGGPPPSAKQQAKQPAEVQSPRVVTV